MMAGRPVLADDIIAEFSGNISAVRLNTRRNYLALTTEQSQVYANCNLAVFLRCKSHLDFFAGTNGFLSALILR
jgi:hypothetical protein